MQRIVSLCPPGERENLVSAVAQSLRLVINQRLAFSTDGKRTALREFLVFDKNLRTRLLEMDPRSWPSLTRKAVEEHGQPFQLAIKNALKEGRISDRTALEELRGIE
jgi:defect-in-organelle-trafficking protein DotB